MTDELNFENIKFTKTMNFSFFVILILFLLSINICSSFLHSGIQPKIILNSSKKNIEKVPEPDLTEDRIQSVKFGAISALSGSLISAPVSVAYAFLNSEFNAQWEFQTDTFAILLFLYGLIYRYTIRDSTNPQIKLGLITSFVLTRTLSELKLPDYCIAFPLNCGPPFYYVSLDMIISGLWFGSIALFGFGGAAFALDYFIRKGFLSNVVTRL